MRGCVQVWRSSEEVSGGQDLDRQRSHHQRIPMPRYWREEPSQRAFQFTSLITIKLKRKKYSIPLLVFTEVTSHRSMTFLQQLRLDGGVSLARTEFSTVQRLPGGPYSIMKTAPFPVASVLHREETHQPQYSRGALPSRPADWLNQQTSPTPQTYSNLFIWLSWKTAAKKHFFRKTSSNNVSVLKNFFAYSNFPKLIYIWMKIFHFDKVSVLKMVNLEMYKLLRYSQLFLFTFA